MPRLAPHHLSTQDRKKSTKSLNRPQNKYTISHDSLLKSPSYDNGSISSFKSKTIKAKVDTWRTRPNEECEKRKCVHIEQKPKRQTDHNNLMKKKIEALLEEVNILLERSVYDKNLTTSKNYLKSVQKELIRSLKTINDRNIPSIDIGVLNLFNEKKNVDSEPSCQDTINTDLKSLDSKNEDQTDSDGLYSKRTFTYKNEPDEMSNPSNVKSLLSFWNDKFSKRPITVCNGSDYSNPKRYLALTKDNPRNAIHLSKDGVAEEHTLKPSELKINVHGASSIVEALKLNSSKNIRKTLSQSAINTYPGKFKQDNFKTDSPVCKELLIGKNIDYKDKFVETRNILLKKSTFINGSWNKDAQINKNKWITSYLKSVDKMKKPCKPIMNGLRMTEILKKENYITITYPYLYIVKCLVEYTDQKPTWKCLFNPGVYRPLSQLDLFSDPYYDDKKYLTMNQNSVQEESDEEYTMSVENISNATETKPVLSKIEKVIDEKKICTLCKLDIEKMFKKETISVKDKVLSCMESIENLFINIICVQIQLCFNNIMMKISPVIDVGHTKAIILMRRERFYVTVTLSMILIGLTMLLAVSI